MRKKANEELGRLNNDEYSKSVNRDLIIIADNVRSMNNIGSIFRTSDAFLVSKIYLCGISATPPHREITKTAIGAEKSVPWEYRKHTSELIDELLSNGFTLIAIEQADDALNMMNVKYPDGPIGFIFGNEIDGVSQDVINKCQYCMEIPQLGTKHSFNVSVSCGMVLWDYEKFKNN